MNILIATGIFPPEIGGPATYSKFIADVAGNYGHTVTVVTYGESNKVIADYAANATYSLYTVSRTLPKGIRHLWYFWHVFKTAKHSDVIFALDPISAGVPAYCAAMLLRKKFVIRVAGDYAWEQSVQRFGVADPLEEFLTRRYSARVELLRTIQLWIVRRATRVIVPSKYLHQVVEKWGVEAKLITIIYNAVSFPEVTHSKTEARQTLGLTGFVLLSVGRLVPWKGFAMLLQLIAELREYIPHVTLLVVGSGPEEEKLKVQSKKLHVEDKVIFTGNVSKDQLGLYIRASDVFLLNTAYEGLSHQLIEAMSIGIPIITTNAGGNREIAVDNENVLIAAYNDQKAWYNAIMSVYTDESLRVRLSQPRDTSILSSSPEKLAQETFNALKG